MRLIGYFIFGPPRNESSSPPTFSLHTSRSQGPWKPHQDTEGDQPSSSIAIKHDTNLIMSKRLMQRFTTKAHTPPSQPARLNAVKLSKWTAANVSLPSVFYADAAYVEYRRRQWTFWKRAARDWRLEHAAPETKRGARIASSKAILERMWRSPRPRAPRPVHAVYAQLAALTSTAPSAPRAIAFLEHLRTTLPPSLWEDVVKRVMTHSSDPRTVFAYYVALLPTLTSPRASPVPAFFSLFPKEAVDTFEKLAQYFPTTRGPIHDSLVMHVANHDPLLAGKLLSERLASDSTVSLKTLNTLLAALFKIGDEKAHSVLHLLESLFGRGNAETARILLDECRDVSDVRRVLERMVAWRCSAAQSRLGVACVDTVIRIDGVRGTHELLRMCAEMPWALGTDARRALVKTWIRAREPLDRVLGILTDSEWDAHTLRALLRRSLAENNKQVLHTALALSSSVAGIEADQIPAAYALGDDVLLQAIYERCKGKMKRGVLEAFARGVYGRRVVADAVSRGLSIDKRVFEALLSSIKTPGELDSMPSILPLLHSTSMTRDEARECFVGMFERLRVLRDVYEELLDVYLSVLE